MSAPDVRLVATRIGGRALEIKQLTGLQIVSGIDSPATSLSASIAPASTLPELLSIRAYDGNRLLFDGKIDSQRTAISKDGVTVVLDARDAGALLLDNQALPCVILRAQLGTVFSRFASAYGFGYYCARPDISIPMFTVRAGMSEWDVIVNFSRRAYGVTPYVSASRVMFSRRGTNAPVVISNSGNGLRFSSVSHTLSPYSVISRVYIRDENGFYSSMVDNPSAPRTQASRKRYVIPATEYASNIGLDANQRLRRSMFGYEQLTVTLPQILDAALGQEAEIRDSLLSRYNLMITKREYIVDANGIVTRLTLASSIYYD